MTFTCTWEEFKRMAKEFHAAAPTLNIEQLDNAWKCLGLHYLGMNEDMWLGSAAILLNMECRIYLNRVMKVNIAGNEMDTYLYNRDNGAGAAELIIAVLKK